MNSLQEIDAGLHQPGQTALDRLRLSLQRRRAARIRARIDTALLDALADTPIARRETDLQRIADMDSDEQQELLMRLQDAEQPPSSLSALMPRREAEPSLPGNVDALKRIWRKSSRAEHREFREYLANQGDSS